jgi:lysozyme
MTLPKAPPGYRLMLDVGRDQGRLDVPALVGAGVDGLIIRTTDGEHDIDPQFAVSAAAATKAGLLWTGYFVLEPYGVLRADAQARHFAQVIRDAGEIGTAPWLDFELAHGLTGLAALQAAVEARDALRAELGSEVVVYLGPSFVETLEKMAGPAGDAVVAQLATSPLAVAHYTGDYARLPIVPPPWTDWLYWQASGGRTVSKNFATLPGRNTDVDVDFTRATLDQLRALGPRARLASA